MKKLIAVLACLAMSAPVFATGNHTNPNPPPVMTSSNSHVPEKILSVGALVALVSWAVSDSKKDEPQPKKDDNPGVIVPPSANDSSTLYGADVNRRK